MAPLRMLVVASVDQLGGAEIGLLRLLPRLREARGWEITLTSPQGGPLRDAAVAHALAWNALPVGGLGRRQGLAALRSFPRVRRLARSHDLVYLNGGVAGRLLPALRGSSRTLLHVHDLVERVPGFWSRADLILADSAAVAARLAGLDAHVVGCPIDPAPAPVSPPWETDGRPVVGFVGRLEPRKGPLDLVRAAPSLLAAGARVILVGDDAFGADPAYTGEVVRSADAAGVERYGWVDDAAGLMGALDVLVLPSHAEPFGTVLAEAMNAGVPVVATRVGGLADVVDDGATGRLVAASDPAAIAAATLEALDRREQWGRAARERARRWHADAYAAHVGDLIEAAAR